MLTVRYSWAAQSSSAGHRCRKLSWAKLDLLNSPTSAVVWLRCHRPLVVVSHTPKTVCWQWTSRLRRISWFAAAMEIWKVHRTWSAPSVQLQPVLGGLRWVKGSSVTVPLVNKSTAQDRWVTFAKKLDEIVTDHEFLVKSYFLSCFQAKVKIENWQTYKINRVYLHDSPISMSVAFSNIVFLPITLV